MVREIRLFPFKVMLTLTCFGLEMRMFHMSMRSAERTQKRILGKYLTVLWQLVLILTKISFSFLARVLNRQLTFLFNNIF